jgi:hypothetical protein
MLPNLHGEESLNDYEISEGEQTCVGYTDLYDFVSIVIFLPGAKQRERAYHSLHIGRLYSIL